MKRKQFTVQSYVINIIVNAMIISVLCLGTAIIKTFLDIIRGHSIGRSISGVFIFASIIVVGEYFRRRMIPTDESKDEVFILEDIPFIMAVIAIVCALFLLIVNEDMYFLLISFIGTSLLVSWGVIHYLEPKDPYGVE